MEARSLNSLLQELVELFDILRTKGPLLKEFPPEAQEQLKQLQKKIADFKATHPLPIATDEGMPIANPMFMQKIADFKQQTIFLRKAIEYLSRKPLNDQPKTKGKADANLRKKIKDRRKRFNRLGGGSNNWLPS